MNDIITTLGKSILQHGKYNDRIYLMKLSKDDFPAIIDKLDKLASAENYSKIIAKVPEFAKDEFTEKGYIIEASIPRFYNGYDDVYFMGKYFTGLRMNNSKPEKIKEILKAALKSIEESTAELIPELNYKICDKPDIPQIVKVYKIVFETYPFPIHEPEYIRKTMDENFIYFSIFKNNNILALSSSEMDIEASNVEINDGFCHIA